MARKNKNDNEELKEKETKTENEVIKIVRRQKENYERKT